MAARRRKKRARPSAPAKGSPRAERSAADGRPTRSLARGLAMLFLPPVASALLLTLAFPPAEISWLAYVALAPLLVTAVRARSTRDAFWAAFAAGVVFFGVNLYWVQPVTTAGYVALVPYMALYWAVGAWLVRRIGRAVPAPMAVVAPAVWVGLELVRGWMLSGLPWLLVGHTQYENLVLIQTADAVGAYGATFLCLATSGLAADLLVRPIIMPATYERPRRINRTVMVGGVLTALAWAGTVGYGVWRLNQDAAREGPVVASVQTAVPQEIKSQARHKQILELEERLLRQQFDLTDSALASARERGLQADLIVWPETMVPGVMNEQFLDGDWIDRIDDADARRLFADLRDRYRGYWSQVREKSRQAGAPILYGAHNQRVDTVARLPGGLFLPQGPRYNTALLISPQTKPHAADHLYSKVHLVPFGEFLPFKRWPWLYKHLLAFTPYSYDYSLTPGEAGQTPFALTFDGRTSRFQVAICYEDAMAYRVREMVRPAEDPERKAVDFIVNISNDGWFVKGWFAADGTYELDQHLNLCVFRAVENRVAIVRSVNTGISAIITPTGRIDEIAETDGRRRNVAGCVVGRLTFDDRVAPYTWLGDVFAKACLMATAVLVIASVVGNLRRRKETAA
ncbi:MAG TPA: apolipoprotein N-acyltransferase [Phycisphaerae bacterium]|nr:apolipoprotein N-acyltransferase [Phycisphaerae bacterium]